MYKVIIAEDEKLVRIGLKHSINWEKYDMSIIDDVDNGIDAYNVYLNEHPDLIIVDIKMPEMDGIELISKIRDKDRQTKIIILSCLDEFEIVRKAVNFGISGYILKLTMTKKEIEQILEQVYNELKLNTKTESEQNNKELDNQKQKEEIVNRLINGINDTEADLIKVNNILNISSCNERMILCLGCFEKTPLNTEKSYSVFNNSDLGKNTLIDIIHQNVGEEFECEAFINNERNFIIIVGSNNKINESIIYNKIKELLDRIRISVHRYFNLSVYFGVSDISMGLTKIKSMFLQSKTAADNKFFYFKSSQIYYKDINAQTTRSLIIDYFSNVLKSINPSDNDFEKRYISKVLELADKVSVEKNENTSHKFLEEICCLLQWIVNTNKCWDENISRILTETLGEILTSSNIECSIEHFSRFFNMINRQYLKHKNYSEHVKAVIKIISENYNKELSLQDIANEIHLSAGYLSTIIKSELKVNFLDYLNSIKLEKAKELLAESDLKSYEISEMIGFSDHTYFSKWFKNCTGISPSQFRKEYGDGEKMV